MVKVGYINSRSLTEYTGTGNYRSNLLKAMYSVGEKYDLSIEPITRRKKLSKIKTGLTYLPGPFDLIHFEPDIHWYGGFFFKQFLSERKCKSALTIHGVTPLYKPSLVGPLQKIRNKYILKSIVDMVDIVFSVSESAKKLISKHLDTPKEKISVTYNGSKFRNHPLVDKKVDSKNYILHVSSSPYDKRKNPELLLKSFKVLSEKIGEVGLVIVGEGWKSERGDELIESMSLRGNVTRAGRVSDDELAEYYAAARLYLQTSIYEDFCLPVVEAMTFGTPVVTTEAYAIPEIAGEAAAFVDPNPHEIGQTMFNILNDKERYRALADQGPKVAQQYTWENTAERTINTYLDILNTEE